MNEVNNTPIKISITFVSQFVNNFHQKAQNMANENISDVCLLFQKCGYSPSDNGEVVDVGDRPFLEA